MNDSGAVKSPTRRLLVLLGAGLLGALIAGIALTTAFGDVGGDDTAQVAYTVDDFAVELRVEKAECSKPDRCTAIVGVHPIYIGAARGDDVPAGVWEFTYEVDGTVGGDKRGSFTVRGESATHTTRMRLRTNSQSAAPTATVTGVRKVDRNFR